MKRLIITATAAAALLTACSDAAPESEAAAATAPQSCLTALDSADHLIGVLAEVVSLSEEGAYAMSEFDVDWLQDVTRRVRDITPEVASASQDYRDRSAECREEGR